MVRPQFVPEQSQPDNNQFLFAYHVRIENQGTETVQLISRHWAITNGSGLGYHRFACWSWVAAFANHPEWHGNGWGWFARGSRRPGGGSRGWPCWLALVLLLRLPPVLLGGTGAAANLTAQGERPSAQG